MLTKEKALEMLAKAPLGEAPSAINRSITISQATGIVIRGVKSWPLKYLNETLEKRVLQVCQNKLNPDKE